MSQNQAAAGYESVRGSLYAPPKIVAKTVELYHECAITPQIARSDFLSDDELFCGSRVIFGVEQDLNLFSQDTDNRERSAHG
jgi:septin family protein